MTPQEAIEMLTAKAECIRREASGTDIDCNHRNCDECDLCYKQGTMGDQMEALGVAISALQAQDVSDTNVGDMVSRQAAIEAALSFIVEYCGAAFDEDMQMELKQRLEELPSAQPEQRWIPCQERMPESKTAYYIVTLENRDRICVLPNDIDIARWDCDRRKGNDSWHWCKERKVIAWKPLPEPYNVNVEGK